MAKGDWFDFSFYVDFNGRTFQAWIGRMNLGRAYGCGVQFGNSPERRWVWRHYA